MNDNFFMTLAELVLNPLLCAKMQNQTLEKLDMSVELQWDSICFEKCKNIFNFLCDKYESIGRM